MSERRDLSERLDSLPRLATVWFAILAGPFAWMAHLNVEYFFVTVHCELNGGSTELLMVATTAVSIALCLAGGAVGYVMWRRLSKLDGAAAGRAGFMAAFGGLLSILFLVGIILGTIPVYTLEQCNAVH